MAGRAGRMGAETGHLAEVEALGKPLETISSNEFKRLYPYVRYNPKYERETVEDRMNHVRSIQQDEILQFGSLPSREISPKNPQRPFARVLREKILKKLEIVDGDRVKFYTSVHTALDFNDGIDGFIDISLDGGRLVTVTLDVTKNPTKEESSLGVLVVHYPGYDFKDEEQKAEFYENTESTSKHVVSRFLSQLSDEDLALLRGEVEQVLL